MRIGPYEINPEPIATGGQARIFRAHKPGSTEVLAIKAVTPTKNVVVHAGKTRRLLREVDALVRIEHPNVPRVIAADPGGEWYVMPLARGDLGGLFAERRVPWQALRAGLLAVAGAVARGHELGLVHRDLHDGNILIYQDRWCVADWGFVYNPRVDRQTRQMLAFGRDFYIAPEILRNPQIVKPAADIFAIGRLADRGAALDGDRESDGPAARWWRTLIDGAGAYDERQRWGMADLLAHLRSPLPMSLPVVVPAAPILALDTCPNCGSPSGFDAACRCVRCHAVSY